MYTLKEKDEVFLGLKPNYGDKIIFDTKDKLGWEIIKELRDEGYVTTDKFLSDKPEIKFTEKGRETLVAGGFQAITELHQQSIQETNMQRQSATELTALQIAELKRLPGENKKTRMLALLAIIVALLPIIFGTCNVHC